jgi:hypothetical protein
MVLAVAGSLLGVLVATWLSATLSSAFLPGIKRLSVAGDPRTLAFIGVITLVVGAFTGVLPVLQARRLTLTDDLKAGARAGTFRRSRTRSALLILQGALSLVLLVGAGLFVRSLRNVRDVRLGFDADSVLVVALKMRDVELDSAQTAALRLRLVGAATTVPGIPHASLQLESPFGGMTEWPIAVAGIDSVRKFGRFEFNAVSPGYFATMGTRILRGRAFTSGDRAGARGAVVVSEAMGKVLCRGKTRWTSASASAFLRTRCRVGTSSGSPRTFTREASAHRPGTSTTTCLPRSGTSRREVSSCASRVTCAERSSPCAAGCRRKCPAARMSRSLG